MLELWAFYWNFYVGKVTLMSATSPCFSVACTNCKRLNVSNPGGFRAEFNGEQSACHVVYWRAWVLVCWTPQSVKSFIFAFANMLFFAHRPLLTRRWKLGEVFMTVVMYPLQQQQGRRGQRIDTRDSEDDLVQLVLIADFLAREFDGFTRFLSLWSPR